MFEPLPPQERCERPGGVQSLAQFVVRLRLKNRVSLFVSQSLCAANHGFRKARALCATVLVELNENRMGETVDPRPQAANAVAQSLRQHRNDPVGQINAVAAPARFAIQRALRFDVRSYIGNVHAQLPIFIVDLLDMNGVVKIARIIRIDRDDEFSSQIFAAFHSSPLDRFRNFTGLIDNVFWELSRKPAFSNDRQHVDAGRSGGSEHFDDLTFWIDVTRFPRLEPDDYFVAHCSGGLCRSILYGPHINVVDEPRIIRDDVIKIARMLQRSDNRIARTFQNSNHAALASSLSIFRAPWNRIARDPRDHAIAVHGCAGVLRCDKNIGLAWSFRCQKSVAGLVDRQFTGHQIGLSRQDVAIFSDARDLAQAFELAQHFSQRDAFAAFQPEFARDLDLIEWPVIFSREERENLFSNFASVLRHTSESLLLGDCRSNAISTGGRNKCKKRL